MYELKHLWARPSGVPRDANFMTPLGRTYFSAQFADGRALHIELSHGEGFSREPIWGVTVRRPNGATTGLSKVFATEKGARAYIADGLRWPEEATNA